MSPNRRNFAGTAGGRALAGSTVGAVVVMSVALLGAPGAALGQRGPLAGLDGYIEEALEAWQVPGLAISVVRSDSILYARGFGVREVGRPERVDARTLFAIGSSSKAFAAATVGILVDEGAVRWDDSATEQLPGFGLFDPYVTRELTVRDLLTHRSGLTRGDLMWYAGEYDRAEILRRVRHLEPSWSFRSRFGYQNIMYLAAGELVREVSGATWDDFVTERILRPIGMRTATTSIVALAGVENVATPHASIDDVVRPVAWRNIDNIAPAGSINANVTEMTQWVRLNLGNGELGGRRILSEDVVREMQTPQTIIRREFPWTAFFPSAQFLTYGLGWFLSDHHGRVVVSHGGNIDGMSAMVALVPSEDFGLTILTNMNGTFLPVAIMYRVIDALLGVPARDWSAELLATRDELEAMSRAQTAAMEEARVYDTRPALPLEKYAGTYDDALYGPVSVAVEDGALVVRYGTSFVGDLEHWHFETFRAVWRDPMLGRGFVTFGVNARGEAGTVDVQPLGTFRRVRDAEAAAIGEATARPPVGSVVRTP